MSTSIILPDCGAVPAMPFVEQGCTVSFEGREFTAGGAIVADGRCVCYIGSGCHNIGNRGEVTDWHGNRLGSFVVTAAWATPRSYVSSRMYQLRVTIGGAVYTGRSAGSGMSFNGKLAKH